MVFESFWKQKCVKRELTSICSMIVAPSLETMTSPSGLMSILSIPFGPKEVFKRFATVLAAMIFAYIVGLDFTTAYLVGFNAFYTLFLVLVSDNNVWSAVFVKN